MRRISTVSFLLSMCLLTGITNYAIAEVAADPIAFSVLYNQTEGTPVLDDWLILEEYTRRQNVVLNISIGDNADYLSAMTRTLDSGTAPDIILKVWPSEIESYAAAGSLLAFSDYEDLMPHFATYIAEHNLEGELDKLRLANGKYYILPGYQRATQVQQWIYRKDLFDLHGLGTPDTYDDLFASLVALKEIYPDSTPITACWGGAHLLAMMGAGYGIPAGWAGTRYYSLDEDRWQFAPASDNYREMYRFLNRCDQAGILDPGTFTQSEADYYAKLLDGRGFVTVSWISSGFQSWNETLADNGFPNGEWAPLPVPESTIGVRAVPSVDPFRKGLVVPSRVLNEPYFEDLLRFLDWAVYSDEGMTLTAWGVEGVTFENTPDGKAFFPNIRTTRNPDGAIDITEQYGLATLFNLNENEEFEDQKKPSEIVAFLNRSLESGETAQLPPQLTLSTSALAAIDQINPTITSYASEVGIDFIVGDLDIDDDWNQYILEAERMGYLTLEAIWALAWEEQTQ